MRSLIKIIRPDTRIESAYEGSEFGALIHACLLKLMLVGTTIGGGGRGLAHKIRLLPRAEPPPAVSLLPCNDSDEDEGDQDGRWVRIQ